MKTFQERLRWCMDKGNLRLVDVARWFDRRHSTVRGWVADGCEPAGTPTDVRNLFERLVGLENKIRSGVTGSPLRQQIARVE